MKKFAFLISFVLFALISCKKENGGSNVQNPERTAGDLVLVSEGTFTFAPGESNTGIVKILKKSNGRYILTLEQFSYKSNIDLELHLSNSNMADAKSIKLFSFQCVNSSLQYEIPASIDITAYRFVLITNDTQAEAIATAEL
jgi:hypothetical protein